MRVLTYTIDKMGIKTYSEYLTNAMKELGIDAVHSDKMDYKNFDVVHIHFDYSQFHPWGIRLIPIIIKLKLNKKKVILTIGTILRKKETYARNKFYAFLKKIIISISTKLMAIFADRITVMIDEMRETLIQDYNISPKKVEVIVHGVC
jgi:glycosyltransferase involved in cell wall biosynthesis